MTLRVTGMNVAIWSLIVAGVMLTPCFWPWHAGLLVAVALAGCGLVIAGSTQRKFKSGVRLVLLVWSILSFVAALFVTDKLGAFGSGCIILALYMVLDPRFEAKHILPVDFEAGDYAVELLAAGERPIAVMRRLRFLLRPTLAEVSFLVKEAPAVVCTGASREKAEEVARQLQEAGGEVRVFVRSPAGQSSPS